MRLLTVRHVTVYRYSEPVEFGEHRMMFRPRESHDLRLLSTKLEILPRPSDLRWLHDVFDNSVAIATFDQPARELRFDSTVTLEHIETALPDYALEIGAHTYPFQYSDDERPDLVNALARHYPCDDLGPWTARFLPSSGPTTTMTLLLMMEAARSLGLAARFVSGYIFVPEVDRAAAVGGGSTHGWMQAYLPGAGWVDFDPTNSIVGNRNLIRVAVAWDQRNALPLWGTFSGPASSFRGMDVDVSVIEETRVVR